MMKIPVGVDWDIYRIVVSPRFQADANRIRYEWSLEDLVDAHLIEDMFDEAERKAASRA